MEQSYAADRVRGPSIALIVTAVVGALLSLTALAGNLLGFALPYQDYGPEDEVGRVVGLVFGSATAAISLAMAFVVGFGALKMQRLETYNFAIAVSILAMIPCISPCCVLGLPIGIWALVVLLDDRVKAAFR